MDQETTTPETVVETPAPATTPSPIAQNTSYTHQVSKGLIIGMIVFGVILITAIYVATSGISMPTAERPQVPATSTLVADTATAAFETQGTSDEISDIERDLNATDFNSLEEINNI